MNRRFGLTSLWGVALVGLVLFGMVVIGGCGGGDEGAGAQGEASGESGPQIDPRTGLVAAPDTIFVQSDTAQEGTYYDSKEGQFRVIWPLGCGQIAVRALTDPPDDKTGKVELAHVFCDRKGAEQEGCAVVTYFDLKSASGGPPDEAAMIAQVQDVIDNYRVVAFSKHPLKRGSMSGAQAHCRQQDGDGEVWVEGYLVGENVYTLFAWKMEGGIFADPQYERFFSSFAAAEVP